MVKPGRREVINRDLILGDAIGAGAYGEVFMAEPIRHGKCAQFDYPPRLVVKVIRGELCTPDFIECADRELMAASNLRHPCVVRYIGMWVEAGQGNYRGSYCIAMHYCDGGDLHDYISGCISRKQPPTAAVVVRVIACVLAALNYCHAQNVIHRDIKPANIFLMKGKSGAIERALIGDFGLARPLNKSAQTVMTRVGTPCYCSPEIVSAEYYTSKADVFSAGATFYELMALERPFWRSQYNDLEVFRRILHLDPMPRLAGLCAGRFDDSLVGLVALCLRKYETERPSAYLLLTHIDCIHAELSRMRLPLYANRGALRARAGEGTSNGHSRSCSASQSGHPAHHRKSSHPSPSRAAVVVPPGALPGPKVTTTPADPTG